MSQPEHLLEVPQGKFTLQRLPLRRRELLRAWDAADEYALQVLDDVDPQAQVLVVNDGFGALAVALSAWRPQWWSDSWISQSATRLNLGNNDLSDFEPRYRNSLETPAGPLDVVVVKVPKTLGLLEDQLIRLRPLLRADTRLLVAGMIKGLPSSVWSLLERLVGTTETLPGWKKAKVIKVTPDRTLPWPPNPYPVTYTLEETDFRITNHANVFSRDSLDIGTRFFLQQLPSLPDAQVIVDLGCGNGIVGLLAAQQHPEARLHFVDESYMAVASARTTFEAAFGAARSADFTVGDGLADVAPASVDLVLCNPPFHQQQAVGDHIAQRLFRQAFAALRPGGELWVVGNRHLGYHVALKALFGQAELIASNAKFVVLRAVRKLS